MAITAYRVLRSPLDHLEDQVMEAISEGWQPYGEPFQTTPSSYVVFQTLIKGVPEGGGGGGPVTVVVEDITDAGATGKAVMLSATAADARTAIGAGTGNSNLALGTTSSTAKAGNYQPTWEQVTGKPAVIGAGATEAAARQAIGAGTSNLVLGTTAGTALAGDTSIPPAYTWTTLPGRPEVVAAGLNAADARASIGAGTSNLELGTTASTALAGNTSIPTIPGVATTSANGLMSAADKTKLNDVATGATANDTNANLLNRANHTGTQAVSTVATLADTLSDFESRIAALEGA